MERFLVKYKNHPQTDYAYYLLALCHYDQIIDERKDMNEILKSKQYFQIIIKDYPNTEYAQDSTYKMDYITVETLGNAVDFDTLSTGRAYIAGCASRTKGIL